MTPTGNCYLSKVIPGHVTGHATRPVIITQPYSVYYCVYCEGTEQQKCCSSLLQENIVRRTQKLTWGRDYKKQKLLLLLLALAGSLANSITTFIGVGSEKKINAPNDSLYDNQMFFEQSNEIIWLNELGISKLIKIWIPKLNENVLRS